MNISLNRCVYVYTYIFSYVLKVLELRALYIVRACVRFYLGTLTLCTGCVLWLWYLHHSAAVCVTLRFASVNNSVFEPRMLKV